MTKTMKTKQTETSRSSAFSLLELLVVVTIIAILSAVMVPAGSVVVGMAKRAAAAEHAKQIVIGLRAYSIDNGGRFPGGRNHYGQPIATSNDAFRDMLEYVDYNEKIFTVSGSMWGATADLKTTSVGEMLRPGENHFAYISGVSPDARGQWPLVVDGTDGGGTYSEQVSERGGLWKGKYAVVGRIDGSVGSERLQGDGAVRYLPKFDDPSKNGLKVAAYMGKGARLLDPALGDSSSD